MYDKHHCAQLEACDSWTCINEYLAKPIRVKMKTWSLFSGHLSLSIISVRGSFFLNTNHLFFFSVKRYHIIWTGYVLCVACKSYSFSWNITRSLVITTSMLPSPLLDLLLAWSYLYLLNDKYPFWLPHNTSLAVASNCCIYKPSFFSS